VNISEYIDLTVQLIRSNAMPPEHTVTAARLGALLRQSEPTSDWRMHGYPAFKDFLQELQKRHLVQLGESAKGALVLRLKEKSFALEASTPAVSTFNPLTKPFWVAFVVEQPRGRRFFHRPSGNIRMGAATAPSPGDEWVEILPVSDQTQHDWAEEFLRNRGLLGREELKQVLNETEWFKMLPGRLAEIEPPLARAWNRERSTRVSEAVKLWCTTHGISPSVAFQSDSKPAPPKISDSRSIVSKPSFSATRSPRDRVLAALSQLPTEYLLEIPIPAKYLIALDTPDSNRRM
jgi:hypothetical protein